MGAKANVTREIVVPVPANELYALLSDYSKYYDIWPKDYKAVTVAHKRKTDFGRKDMATVEFEHTPIMGYSMAYKLNVEGVPGRSVLWTLNSSNLLASNVGGWTLKDQGNGETKVSYGCAVELNANVPGFVTSFILGQAFPKMLKTFSKSAVREWEIIQAERRARFERPLQAAAGSLNATIRSLEQAAEEAASAAKTLAGSTVADFSSRVDESLAAVRNAMSTARQTSAELESSPKLESTLDKNLEMLEAAATSLKSLANATVLELSTSIDTALRDLETAAESASESANELAGRTASQLADMQSGKVDSVPGVPSAASNSSKGNGFAGVVRSGWAAFANGALNVLETIVPGERPATKPSSKRERLGNILGKDWSSEASPDGKVVTTKAPASGAVQTPHADDEADGEAVSRPPVPGSKRAHDK